MPMHKIQINISTEPQKFKNIYTWEEIPLEIQGFFFNNQASHH